MRMRWQRTQRCYRRCQLNCGAVCAPLRSGSRVLAGAAALVLFGVQRARLWVLLGWSLGDRWVVLGEVAKDEDGFGDCAQSSVGWVVCPGVERKCASSEGDVYDRFGFIGDERWAFWRVDREEIVGDTLLDQAHDVGFGEVECVAAFVVARVDQAYCGRASAADVDFVAAPESVDAAEVEVGAVPGFGGAEESCCEVGGHGLPFW